MNSSRFFSLSFLAVFSLSMAFDTYGLGSQEDPYTREVVPNFKQLRKRKADTDAAAAAASDRKEVSLDALTKCLEEFYRSPSPSRAPSGKADVPPEFATLFPDSPPEDHRLYETFTRKLYFQFGDRTPIKNIAKLLLRCIQSNEIFPDPDRFIATLIAYHNTHPISFGGAETAAAHEKRLLHAASIQMQDAQALYGKPYVQANLEPLYKRLERTVEENHTSEYKKPAITYKPDMQPDIAAYRDNVRWFYRKITNKINAAEELRAMLSQDLRGFGESEGITSAMMREANELLQMPSLSEIAMSQPWVDPEATQSMTQAPSSQSTLLLEENADQ
jgi:hypothetical protein